MLIKWTEGTEDLHEVVPAIWLTDDDSSWYPTSGDVRSLASNYRMFKQDWSKVVVEKRSVEFSSYEEAVVHMTSCTTTENETDDQEGILNSPLGQNQGLSVFLSKGEGSLCK